MFVDVRCRNAKSGWAALSALFLTGLAIGAGPASAVSPAMVADNDGDRVIVFDAASDTVLGSVAIGSGIGGGDCSISSDSSLGYVTARDSSVWVIDLEASPPALASGPNPIPISNPGLDTALTPDGRFLLVCGLGLPAPVSVVDLSTRAEVDSFDPGHGCSAVEVCDDGSVLIGFYDIGINFKIVRRLTLDASGQLADTGISFAPDEPENLSCARGSATALTFGFGDGAESFSVSDLTPIDSVGIGPFIAIGGQVGARGDRLFIRGSNGTTGVLTSFDYDSDTGEIGDMPRFEFPVSGPPGLFGADRLVAYSGGGSKLYVSEPGSVDVYDSETGGFLTAMTDPAIVSPTGICVASAIFVDGFESGDTSAWTCQEAFGCPEEL